MARYVSRHGQVAAADALVELTDLGSDGTSLDPITVLPGEKSIKQFWAVPGNEAATKTACGGPTIYEISGSGVVNGPHYITGYGYAMIATGNCAFYKIKGPRVLPVEIGLKAGDIIVKAACDGTDAGTPNPGYTLAITGQGARNCRYESRFATCTALSTSTAMSGTAGGGTKTTISPAGFKKITRIFTSYSNELPLDTAAGGSCIAKILGGLTAGEFDLVCGAHGSLTTTTGATGGYSLIADTGPLNLELSGSPIIMYAEQTGVDHGTAMPTVTLELSM